MRSELLERLDLYLAGKASLQAVETWLLANLQAILDSGDSEAIAAANEVDASLMALSEGLIEADELRERIGALVEQGHTIWVPSNRATLQSTASASSAEAVRRKVEIREAVVSLRLSHQFV